MRPEWRKALLFFVGLLVLLRHFAPVVAFCLKVGFVEIDVSHIGPLQLFNNDRRGTFRHTSINRAYTHSGKWPTAADPNSKGTLTHEHPLIHVQANLIFSPNAIYRIEISSRSGEDLVYVVNRRDFFINKILTYIFFAKLCSIENTLGFTRESHIS